MSFIVLEYLKKSVRPGGTPTRLKEWAGFILWTQALVLYLANAIADPMSIDMGLVVSVTVLVWLFWFTLNPRLQVPMLQLLIYFGLFIQVLAVYRTDADISGTIYFMVWSSVALLAERREYTNFAAGLSTMMLVFFGLAWSVYQADDHYISGATSIATFISGSVIALMNFYLLLVDYRGGLLKIENLREQFERLEKISESMSEILSKKEPVSLLLWHVAQRCMPLMELDDFVIYLYDESSGTLKQVAAYGIKSEGREIQNPLEIKPGEGVVGRCYAEGRTIRVMDTKEIDFYLVDVENHRSELAVPIFSGDKVVGVLDSESAEPGFYKLHHMRFFEIIASFCGIKITDEQAQSQIHEAELAKQLAEQFKELDELKNRFISNISHDLKTPLSLIKGPAQQIQKTSQEEETLKHAAYIQKNTEHLLHMVEQLLQLQRLDHGLKHLYPERFQLCDIIQPLVEQFESLIERKKIHLEVKRCEVIMFTDRFKLQQCVHNLLQNAFKYTPDGGSVGIKIFRKPDDGDLFIEVCDSGPGISQEHHRKIFDRFYKTDVNNHEGTGIGLSLVKEYMEMIGGTVDYSASPYGGACFTLKLDRKLLENVDTETQPTTGLLDTENPVVLVVEDHPELNEFIASSLRSQYQVIQAFDGQEAWKKVQEDMPDLVLADLMLPHMQGEELLRRIKEDDNLAHIPVVILSSKSKVPDKVELYGLGAENYLVKPFDADELLAVIKNCFERRKQLQQLLSDKGIVLKKQHNLSPENEWMNELMQLIRENLDSPELSGAFIGESLGMGRNRLQRELKAATGLSPAEFIRFVRLEEAKNLLENSKLTVSEVAYSVGFNNLSYFTRSFKTQYDVLPSEVNRAAEV
ncbi:MAG: response regulator [Bacteroidetes bacterium]|nr:MAG: response regulator [Bacteroidota bacterium]